MLRTGTVGLCILNKFGYSANTELGNDRIEENWSQGLLYPIIFYQQLGDKFVSPTTIFFFFFFLVS